MSETEWLSFKHVFFAVCWYRKRSINTGITSELSFEMSLVWGGICEFANKLCSLVMWTRQPCQVSVSKLRFPSPPQIWRSFKLTNYNLTALIWSITLFIDCYTKWNSFNVGTHEFISVLKDWHFPTPCLMIMKLERDAKMVINII